MFLTLSWRRYCANNIFFLKAILATGIIRGFFALSPPHLVAASGIYNDLEGWWKEGFNLQEQTNFGFDQVTAVGICENFHLI